jgi:hypothetical protein
MQYCAQCSWRVISFYSPLRTTNRVTHPWQSPAHAILRAINVAACVRTFRYLRTLQANLLTEFAGFLICVKCVAVFTRAYITPWRVGTLLRTNR